MARSRQDPQASDDASKNDRDEGGAGASAASSHLTPEDASNNDGDEGGAGASAASSHLTPEDASKNDRDEGGAGAASSSIIPNDDSNNDRDVGGVSAASATLTFADARKILKHVPYKQLVYIVAEAMCHSDGRSVLDAVRSIKALRYFYLRRVVVRSLNLETSDDALFHFFSQYGNVEEASVIREKNTGDSQGYGFVTFSHADGAVLALKEPSKKFEGHMIATLPYGASDYVELSERVISVEGLPPDMTGDDILNHFSTYGEIEEGPIGPRKMREDSDKRFAFIVFETVKAAKDSLKDADKIINGHLLHCWAALPDPPPSEPGELSGGYTGTPGMPEFAGAGVSGSYGPPSWQYGGYVPYTFYRGYQFYNQRHVRQQPGSSSRFYITRE